MLVPAGIWVSWLEGGLQKWCLPTFLFLDKFLKDNCPPHPVQVISLVNKTLFCIPRCFQLAASMLYLARVAYSFSSLQLPQSWSWWFLKYLKSRPTDCKNSWSCLTGSQSQMLCGLVFPLQVPHVWGAWFGVCSSPFFEITVSLPFVVSLTRTFVPNWIFASITI